MKIGDGQVKRGKIPFAMGYSIKGPAKAERIALRTMVYAVRADEGCRETVSV